MPKSDTKSSLVEVTFAKPIMRGEQEIASVKLREPKTGEMRGIAMVDLVQLDTDALIELLPRITMPPLTKPEVEDLPPSETFKMAREVADFLVPEAKETANGDASLTG